MSTISLAGYLVHETLLEGAFPPCAGATVQIFDLDQGGNGDDLTDPVGTVDADGMSGRGGGALIVWGMSRGAGGGVDCAVT